MNKITKLVKDFFKSLFSFVIFISLAFNPSKVHAEISETEINGDLINSSSEFLRDLDFETWQLVAYKFPLFEDKLILRVIGYPVILGLIIQQIYKWTLEEKVDFSDKTLLNLN